MYEVLSLSLSLPNSPKTRGARVNIALLAVIGFSFIVPSFAFASTTSGTIDGTNKYAWSENTGWIDFGTTVGAVMVTDSALSGYAYGENMGWISLNCSNTSSCGSNSYAVTNNGNGTLSGYAWGENVGYINFASTTINSSGVFGGYAYGENIGWINFATQNPVTTDWRPASVRNASTPTPTPVVSSGGGGGGSISPAALAALLGIGTTTASSTVPGCPAGFTCTPKPVLGCPSGFTCVPAVVPPSTNYTPIGGSSLPSLDLTLGSRGIAITNLQNFLISQSDLGSQYNTGYFGIKTQQALAKYQSDNGITPASGYYGPKTRSFIAGNTTFPTSTSTPLVIPVSLPTAPTISSTTFTRNLTIGSTGSDVKALQQYLNNHGYTIASTGLGSPGNESTYFGLKTEQALSKLQSDNNITPSTGYFGAKTRAFINNQ